MTASKAFRTETDTMGAVEVPADRYWGAQTQRSLENFPIGTERMPIALVRAFGAQKKAAAIANRSLGLIERTHVAAIVEAADEVIAGALDDHFPLAVWQTGSGTQTNMNLNEVIANRANEILGGKRGTKSPVHPNDHVNLGQSSNDSFPTAMHIAAALTLRDELSPALDALHSAFRTKAREFARIVKIGRTHLQDATPMTLGQEFSGYQAQIEQARSRLRRALPLLYPVAQGGTAIGTGLNAHPDFARRFTDELAKLTGFPFRPAANRFAANASHDTLVEVSGTLNVLAVSLNKIANDIRLLGSGPRAGLGELVLPANEPGSSIMPGKVNPTQAEALTMVCLQVMGNHTIVSMAGAAGQLELNAYKPLIAHNLLQSIRLLADAGWSFALRCVQWIEVSREPLQRNVENSLMLATALSPHIGYDAAAAIAKQAFEQGSPLRDAALESGLVSPEQYDAWVVPERMTRPG